MEIRNITMKRKPTETREKKQLEKIDKNETIIEKEIWRIPNKT